MSNQNRNEDTKSKDVHTHLRLIEMSLMYPPQKSKTSTKNECPGYDSASGSEAPALKIGRQLDIPSLPLFPSVL